MDQMNTVDDPGTQRGWLRLLVTISVPVLLILGAVMYYLANDQYVSTDNAYVQQDRIAIAPEITGRVLEVAVKENQHVNAGDLLFRIDPTPFRIAIAQADAAIAAAQVNVVELKADYGATDVDIASAAQAVDFYQKEYQRQAALMGRGFTTRARLQAAEHALDDARGRLGNARAEAMKAQASLATGTAVPGVNPDIAAAQAQRSKAVLDLARTELRAPTSGTISQSDKLHPGQMAFMGVSALSIVASDHSWVQANFKETDLNLMRVGQPVTVWLDAYPDLKLKGHVASIGAGTGSEFSVLPAQNATGNWVKVTQRVPVRIFIDEPSPRQLIAGQSAHIRVDTSKHGG